MMRNERGQSTIEFIVTFCFGVSVIFMIFTSALNYTTGYLIHYATYMAARTYLVTETNTGTVNAPSVTLGNTLAVFHRYRLDGFKITDEKFSINALEVSGTTPNEYLTVGGKTIFDQRIDAVGQVTGAKDLEHVSEAFLGHEPTRAMCANRTCHGIRGKDDCTNNMDITLYDNGC
jgi:hypothetical protein